MPEEWLVGKSVAMGGGKVSQEVALRSGPFLVMRMS